MNFIINQVATTGCEIRNDREEIIGWSVDAWWAKIITEALEKYSGGEDGSA